MTSPTPQPPASPPDLFEQEARTLTGARAVHDDAAADGAACRSALGELLDAYERLLRETRRLVRHSDRAELEMTQLNQRLQSLAAELEFRATHDPLTGALNRAAIIELATQHLAKEDLAMVILDIDHFKRVNDSFGHPVGDSVICGVVTCLKSVVPPIARIGRVGGEEFTVLLPEFSLDAVEGVAEQMRQTIADHPFNLPDRSHVTASFGVTWLPQGGSFSNAYNQADAALYAAKRDGRNRVVRSDRAD